MSSLRRQTRRVLIAGLLLLALGACRENPIQILPTVDPVPSIKIASLAQRSEGANVVVEGKVIAIAPMVKQSVYELKDDSGAIWVLTDSKPPTRNAQVKVHGVIRSSNGERYIDQK